MPIRQSGYAAMEVLIAVVLVMILTAGAVNLLANVTHNANTSSLERDLSTLRDDIALAFTSRRSYTGLNNALVHTLDIAPASLKGFNGPGGSTIRIEPDGTDDRFFIIQFSDFSSDSEIARATCTALIPGRGSDWDAFIVNGTPQDADDFSGALSACASANSYGLRGQ